MKTVLLIYPHSTSTPVIPGSIPIMSGIARDRGWRAIFFDAYRYEKPSLDNKRSVQSAEFKAISGKRQITMLPANRLLPDLQSLIDTEKPDVIGVSCMTIDYEYFVPIWKTIVLPQETITVIGGLHAILCAKKVAADGLFDLVCIGEGEEVFDELLAKLEAEHPIDNILGTIHVERKSGIVKDWGKRRLLQPEKLWVRHPDYSLFSDEYFRYPFDGRLCRRFAIEIARGCPYSCTYCGNTALKRTFAGLGKFVRLCSVDSVIGGLDVMVQNHHIDLFYLMGECFLSHPTWWLQEFSAQYAKRIRLPFIIQTRPETVTPAKLDILDAMGAPFYQVSMGVESGSERILFEICNRQVTKKRILEAYALLRERNIRTSAFFMIGIPSETREDIFESIRLCREIKSTVAEVNIFQPLPGQDLRELCIREGFITGNEPQLSFTGGSQLKMPQITADEINNLRRVFMLYANLPDEYWPKVEMCERNFHENQELYDELVELRWRLNNDTAVLLSSNRSQSSPIWGTS